MIFKFHGGAEEVGKSCIEIKTDTHRILLDAGLKITPDGTAYPTTLENINEIDAVFISHAHLDHTGALPWLDSRGLNCPVFCTSETKDLTRLLLKDAYHIGKIKNHHLTYDVSNIKDILRIIRKIKTGVDGNYDNIKFEFYIAGHIPGSASILLTFKDENKTVLYTGDINTTETHLVKPANTNYEEKIDIMITEATYGDREHPKRRLEEERFKKEIQQELREGHTVIISVFAVGRAQEVLLMLANMKINVPVYLDGMAKDATILALKEPDSIKDVGKLKAALRRVKEVKGTKHRLSIIKENRQAVYVTTSGMLTGGPIISYLKRHYDDTNCSILLTGYQGHHTNGRLLLEKGYVYLDGHKYNIKCNVNQFDFSAHSGQSELKALIRKVNPQHLIVNHGDEDAIKNLALWAHALDYKVYTPKVGDTIEIK